MSRAADRRNPIQPNCNFISYFLWTGYGKIFRRGPAGAWTPHMCEVNAYVMIIHMLCLHANVCGQSVRKNRCSLIPSKHSRTWVKFLWFLKQTSIFYFSWYSLVSSIHIFGSGSYDQAFKWYRKDWCQKGNEIISCLDWRVSEDSIKQPHIWSYFKKLQVFGIQQTLVLTHLRCNIT